MLVACVYYRMSGPAGELPLQSLSIEAAIEGAPIRKPRRVVEYYDGETDMHRVWTAPKHPDREGYAFPDSIVYSLEGERDYLRRREMELEGEVTCLQAEVSRLLTMVETLQEENSELRADRVRIGEKLKTVQMVVKATKSQVKKKDIYLARGMSKVRAAYEDFDKATLVVAEAVGSYVSEPSVQGRELVPVTGEVEGSNANSDQIARVVPEIPVEDPRPYMGWNYG